MFWCSTCILAVEHKAKPVVFSYASASHPHVATLSHHYRAPPSPEPQLQHYLPPSGQHFQQPIPPAAFQNNQSPNTAAHSIPPPLQPSTSQSFQPENFHQQGGHIHGDGVIHYHDRSSDLHHPPISSPTLFYDQTTVRPYGYESSTVVYHNHQPVDNHNNYYYYRPVSATDHPPDYDLHRFEDQSTVPPDLGYSPTPIYYNDGPTDNSPNIQPYSYDLPQGYDHSSTGVTYPQIHHDGLTDNLHHFQNPRPNPGQQFHDYTTPQPIYYDRNYKNDNHNNNIPIDYESPQNISIVKSPQVGSNLTNPPHNNQNLHFDGSLNQNFPDYQTSDSPEYFYQHSSHPPRGDKTFSPLPPLPTPIYYEDENEYSTTPVVEFESAKQNLPPIKDYPAPKPGYITKPSENPFNLKKNIEREQRTRRPSTVSEKRAYINDKVLQKPKYFAYSSDVFDDNDGLDGEIEQDGNQSMENNDEDDHQQKKKDEKYTKGGGQEHHSNHKTAAGDKGNKGYKSGHMHEEEKKGHHKKEDHKGKYVDEKGKKGKKEEEGGHYGEHHKAEKGKKAAKYGESGEHKKGHSTKGEHNIHKVDEYMKKHEFYDEHHEGGDHKKFGGFMEAHTNKKGGKKKKGHHKGGHHQKQKGKKGHHQKGHKLGHHKGHKDAKGYDGHFSKHKKYGKKGGSKKGKTWGYSKGHPPK